MSLRIAVTHLNADLDGLASLVALLRLDPSLEAWLPGSMDRASRVFWKEHRSELPPVGSWKALRRRLESESPELLVVADCCEAHRLGELAAWVPRFAQVRAWDTHPAGPGQLPRVELAPAAACASAMVLELERRGLRPPPAEAGLLLLGIHADTGHFTFPSTTPLDHRAAAVCLGWGVPSGWVERYAARGLDRRQLELAGRMAENVHVLREGGSEVAIMELETGRYEPDLAVLLERLREAEGWPAAFLLAASGERIHAIGRSRGELDSGAVLRGLGGGGHPHAASAVLRGLSMVEARAALHQAIRDALAGAWTAGRLAVSPFRSLPEHAPVARAAELLHQHRVNALPLTAGRGARVRYTGLVTRQDVDAALRHGLGERPVGEISAGPPVWVPPEATLEEVRAALVRPPARLVMVGHPPGRAAGVLTRGLVFEALAVPLPGQRTAPRPSKLLALARRQLGEAWEHVLELGRVGRELGFSVHLVGGTVRDVLLERPARDVDLVVEGEVPVLAREVEGRRGAEVSLHEPFGTARLCFPGGVELDLATARAETYDQPASLPRVIAHAALRQDLHRRDFTVNAMALSVDPEDAGHLEDPFGGLEDLRAGRLRVLHGLSFHDDPTRAFRAVRFAARFDFELAPQTRALLKAALASGSFRRLGLERLGSEIELLLGEPEVANGFRLLRRWGLEGTISPGFRVQARLLQQLRSVLDARELFKGLSERPAPGRADVLWIVLSAALPAPERAERERLVPGGRSRHRRWLYGPARVRRALSRLSRVRRNSTAARALRELDAAELVVALGWSRSERVRGWIAWWERTGRQVRSGVDGDTLKALGHVPSPAFRGALEAALDAALDGEDEERQLDVALGRLGGGG